MSAWSLPSIDALWYAAFAMIPMAALVLLLGAVLRLRPATRHALWCTVLLMLVALPFLPSAPTMLVLTPVETSSSGPAGGMPSREASSATPAADKASLEEEYSTERRQATKASNSRRPKGRNRSGQRGEANVARSESVTPIPLAQAPDSVGPLATSGVQSFRVSTAKESSNSTLEQPKPQDPRALSLSSVLAPTNSFDWAEVEKRTRPLIVYVATHPLAGRTHPISVPRRRSAKNTESDRKDTVTLAGGLTESLPISGGRRHAHAIGNGTWATVAEAEQEARESSRNSSGVPIVSGDDGASVSSKPTPEAGSVSGSVSESPTLRTWLLGVQRIRSAVLSLPPIPKEIWGGGIAVFVFLGMVRMLLFRLRLRESISASHAVQRMVRRAAEAMGLRYVPEVRMIRARVSPMIWCGRNSRLLLPAELWSQLDEISRNAVVLHELAHLKRRDHWVRRVEILIGWVYWWNPLVLWIRRRLEEEADASCDAWVTWLEPRARGAYARALLRTHQFMNAQAVAVPPAGIGMINGRAKRFARRLTMVMTQNGKPGLSLPGAALMCVLALAGWFGTPARSCEPEATKAKAAKAAKCDSPDCKHCSGRCDCKKSGDCCGKCAHAKTPVVLAVPPAPPASPAPCSPAAPPSPGSAAMPPMPPMPAMPAMAPRAAAGPVPVAQPGMPYWTTAPGSAVGPAPTFWSMSAPGAPSAVAPGHSASSFEDHMRSRRAPRAVAVGMDKEDARKSHKSREKREEAKQRSKVRTEAVVADAERMAKEAARHGKEIAAEARRWAEQAQVEAAEVQRLVQREVHKAMSEGGAADLLHDQLRRQVEGRREAAESHLGHLEAQLDELRAQLDELGRAIETHRATPQPPPSPRAPRPDRERMRERLRELTAQRDSGEIVVRKYDLPEGKLKDLTELMIRNDVPVRVRPVEGGLEVHGTPRQHRIMAAFVRLIHPDGESRGEAEGSNEFDLDLELALADVAKDVEPDFDIDFAFDVNVDVDLDDDADEDDESDDDADEDEDEEEDEDEDENEADEDEHRGDAESLWGKLAMQLVQNLPVVAEYAKNAANGDVENLIGQVAAASDPANGDTARHQKGLTDLAKSLGAQARVCERQIRALETEIRNLEKQIRLIEREAERADREADKANEGVRDDADESERTEAQRRNEEWIARGNEARDRVNPILEQIDELNRKIDSLRESADALHNAAGSLPVTAPCGTDEQFEASGLTDSARGAK